MNAIQLWSQIGYFGVVLIIVLAMLGISYATGEKHKQRYTDTPYESGNPPTGTARIRISAKFYLIAIFFVVFDLETAFIFAWAIAFRDVGWNGYYEIIVFIGVLLADLIYLWRVGALDWGTDRRKSLRARKE